MEQPMMIPAVPQAFALFLALSGAALAVDPLARLPMQLPRDSSTPVIIMDFEGPTGSDPGSDQFLAIYADGRTIVSVAGEPGRQITGQIPPREFEQLLSCLLVENQLLRCETSRMQHEVRLLRRARQRPEPGLDAATTVIRVRGSDAAHEVRCHALGLTASQLPELTQVQDLFASQQRLENVAAIIRAGGYDNVNAVLSAANRKLKQQAPQSDLLTCRELSLVDIRPDGTRYLQFSRFPNADGLQPVGGFVMVSVYQSPGRPPEITVTADAS
jgi:hypothetical protein